VRYANIKGKLFVTNQPSGIAFAKNGGKVLTDSQEYQDAAQSSGLPDKPQVVLYVDIHSTIPLIERLGKTRLPAAVAQNLKPLRSAVEYAVSHSHEIQVSFFLRIQ
jgi:precorrin isomerase